MSFNILHTEWSMGWGGQEIRIVAESVAFIKKGYNMMIACQHGSMIMQQAKEANILTIPLTQRKGISLSAIRKCMRIIKQHRIDLVHTHSSPDAWNCGIAAKLLGVPVLRSRHLSTPVSRSPFSYFLYMKLADRVITSGNAIRDTLIQRNRMVPKRIISIPAGIDEKRFSPSVDPSTVREEFHLTEDDFVVGIVAVIRTWKGHQYLIKAVSNLIRKNMRIKLLIVGTGPHENSIRTLIKEEGIEGHVFMAGYRKDVPTFIKTMDCLVLPSTKNEATSQVLPQAMAMRVPVIAADTGGLSEVVIHHETGLLVLPHNVEALSKAISWIHEHPHEAKCMAERGYEHCMRNFTFDKMINNTEWVYLELLRKNEKFSKQFTED